MGVHTRCCTHELQPSCKGWLDHLAGINAALSLAKVEQRVYGTVSVLGPFVKRVMMVTHELRQ